MTRRRVEQYALQDRDGQAYRPNTWGAIIYDALPQAEFISSNELFKIVAAKHTKIEYSVLSQYLTSMKKRQLIERQRIPSNRHGEMQQRRLG